jgi:hypothetical protein
MQWRKSWSDPGPVFLSFTDGRDGRITGHGGSGIGMGARTNSASLQEDFCQRGAEQAFSFLQLAVQDLRDGRFIGVLLDQNVGKMSVFVPSLITIEYGPKSSPAFCLYEVAIFLRKIDPTATYFARRQSVFECLN